MCQSDWASMYRTVLLSVGIAIPLLTFGASEREQVETTKEILSKWVETRQLISRTKQDWESDREVLRQTISMFERELAAVNEQFASTEKSHAQIEKERAELLAQNEALDAANARAKDLLAPSEAQVRKLANSLPAPLRSKIEPLLVRIPEAPEETKLSAAERMQTLIGIISEVEKFNGSITVNSEIQKNAQGEEVQVKTMYLGLAQAYWVDKSGRAGVGVPGPDGWEWSEKPDLARPINRAIAIYENSQPAAFVSLPVTLK